VELVQISIRPIDDEQMAVARGSQIDVAGVAAFNPVRLRNRLARNRIEGKAGIRRVIDAVALVGVIELDRLLRQGAVDDGVRESVDLNAARSHVPPKSGCVWRVDPLLMNAM